MEVVISTYAKLPILDAEELQAIFAAGERTPDGCLIVAPGAYGQRNPLSINIQGRICNVSRLVWAETYGEADLDTHDVVHIPECPHTSANGETGYRPVCIEPTHLALATKQETVRFSRERGTRPPPCGHTDRSPSGQCRVCNREACARYDERKRSQHAQGS